LTITKYSSTFNGTREVYNEIEEWQKQKHLNLKYINLSKLEIWRRQGTTKFILLEITEDHFHGSCGRLANQVNKHVYIEVEGMELKF